MRIFVRLQSLFHDFGHLPDMAIKIVDRDIHSRIFIAKDSWITGYNNLVLVFIKILYCCAGKVFYVTGSIYRDLTFHLVINDIVGFLDYEVNKKQSLGADQKDKQ